MIQRRVITSLAVAFFLASPCASAAVPPTPKPKQAKKSTAAKAKKPAKSMVVPAAAWQPLKDKKLAVTLKDGTEVSGQLLGVEGDVATLVNEAGTVRAVDLYDVAEVKALNVPTPEGPSESKSAPRTYSSEAQRRADLDRTYGPSYEGKRGRGMHVTAQVMFPIGVVATMAGVLLSFLGKDVETETVKLSDSGFEYVEYGSAPGPGKLAGYALLPVGLVHLAIGIPLLVVGTKRMHRYDEWIEQQPAVRAARLKPRLLPSVGGGRNGWTVGMRLNF